MREFPVNNISVGYLLYIRNPSIPFLIEYVALLYYNPTSWFLIFHCILFRILSSVYHKAIYSLLIKSVALLYYIPTLWLLMFHYISFFILYSYFSVLNRVKLGLNISCSVFVLYLISVNCHCI